MSSIHIPRRRFLWLAGAAACAFAGDPEALAGRRVLVPRGDVDLQIPSPCLAGRVELRETFVIDRPGDYDFGNRLHVWVGRPWPKDHEYGPPALHVLASGVTVRNFAFAGAPDGVHVGGLEWSGGNAVRDHPAVEDVRFVNLQATDIREDALTCQRNTRRVRVEDSHFWGGDDKVIQNDHCRGLVVRGCGFYRGSSSVRFKSRTSGEVRGCRFIACRRAVHADGNAWPEDYAPGRRRRGGRTVVRVSDNLIYGAAIALEAGRATRIAASGNRYLEVREKYRARDGGTIG